MFRLVFLMFVGHAVCDYALQSDFMARGKNRIVPIPGVPWFQVLLAHSLIHAGAVYLITGVWQLAILELIIHTVVDDSKCVGLFGNNAFNKDQLVHYLCKIVWAILAIYIFGK